LGEEEKEGERTVHSKAHHSDRSLPGGYERHSGKGKKKGKKGKRLQKKPPREVSKPPGR